jgi:hypothetical protein
VWQLGFKWHQATAPQYSGSLGSNGTRQLHRSTEAVWVQIAPGNCTAVQRQFGFKWHQATAPQYRGSLGSNGTQKLHRSTADLSFFVYLFTALTLLEGLFVVV